MRDHEAVLDINGTQIWTATRGGGPPVVLLHGGPGICDYLAPVAAMLEDAATLHRYEQRGCGRSAEQEPITIDALIADLDALRSHWGHDRWALVGHSWGANLALVYAMRHPDRVTKLVYLCGVGITNDWKPEYRKNREARFTSADLARWTELAQLPDDAALDTEAMEILTKSDFSVPSRLASVPRPLFAYPTNRRVNSRLNADWDARVASGELASAARLMSMPTLVLHGDGDPRPWWSARALAESIPGATFTLLEDVGHDPFWERPDPLASELRSFLR